MKTFFKHSLPTQEIILRRDADTEDPVYEQNVGQMYPLIRIKKYVVEFPAITWFNFSAGGSLLPTVTFSFDDSTKQFREVNFIEQKDIITIFVGNAKDETYEPIKNDYLITSVNSSQYSDSITIEATLHVPKLYNGYSRVFNMSSFEVFKKLAKELGLGFVSNIENTDDKMSWIQYQINYSFIEFLKTNSRTSIDSNILVFVDQFANLNVIDAKVALQDSSDQMIATELITGNKLSEPIRLVLSTNDLAEENPVQKPIISSWSPSSEFGQLSKIWPSKTITKTFNTLDNSSVISEEIPQIYEHLQERSTFTHFETDNAYKSYTSSKVVNQMNAQLLQGIKLSIVLDNYVPYLFLLMNVPVEIYNIAKHPEIVSQERSDTIDNMDKLTPDQPVMTYELNTRFSGLCIILELSISFSGIKNTYDTTKRLRQSATLLLKKQTL
jgi:hypothetical protein